MLRLVLNCCFPQLQSSPEAPPSPPTEPVVLVPSAKIASPTVSSTGEGDQNELKTLMEECKRLQAENAQLKQKQKEFTVSERS